MRIQSITLGAAGVSKWQPVNLKQKAFAVGIATIISSGASLTYTVEHTFDDLGLQQAFSAVRVATTATVTMPLHGLTVGDSIQVSFAGAPFDGLFTVLSVTNENVFTYTVLNSGALVSSPGSSLVALRVFPNDVLVSKTGRENSNYAFPVSAVRINVTAYTSGHVTLLITQGV
jgi:hypothetical protein